MSARRGRVNRMQMPSSSLGSSVAECTRAARHAHKHSRGVVVVACPLTYPNASSSLTASAQIVQLPPSLTVLQETSLSSENSRRHDVNSQPEIDPEYGATRARGRGDALGGNDGWPGFFASPVDCSRPPFASWSPSELSASPCKLPSALSTSRDRVHPFIQSHSTSSHASRISHPSVTHRTYHNCTTVLTPDSRLPTLVTYTTLNPHPLIPVATERSE
jgi:hypothetical protein